MSFPPKRSMVPKQDSAAVITSGPIPPPSTSCFNCGLEERLLHHHVSHCGNFRRLCTSCVLRLHPQSFCPSCFAVYQHSPPTNGVTCFKCYSSSHPHCVGPNPPKPYVCPLCIKPRAPIFAPKNSKDVNFSHNVGGKAVNNENFRRIDKTAARVLLAAASISCMSLSKAASAARLEAERKAEEAAYMRKRARVALDHLNVLAAREKMNRDGGVVGNSKNRVVDNVGMMDSSIEVLAGLNAVELREKEIAGPVNPQNVVVPWPNSNDVTAMDVDEDRGFFITPSLKGPGQFDPSQGHVNMNGRSCNSSHPTNHQGPRGLANGRTGRQINYRTQH